MACFAVESAVARRLIPNVPLAQDSIRLDDVAPHDLVRLDVVVQIAARADEHAGVPLQAIDFHALTVADIPRVGAQQKAQPAPNAQAMEQQQASLSNTADLTLNTYDKAETDELRHELGRMPVANVCQPAFRNSAGNER